jgi:hypothetical protein
MTLKHYEISEMSTEEELQELNRRAEEMENNPMVCIPHERVYDIVMMRIGNKKENL